MAIKFGTEGWRGRISRDFCFEGVRRATAALAHCLEEDKTARKGVAIGYDRRFLSDEYAAEAAGTLAARGIRVRLCPEPIPTPVLSWAVKNEGLAAGIMITASHNPPQWNGFKIKGPHGGPAEDSLNRRVEKLAETLYVDGASIPCEKAGHPLITPISPREGYTKSVFSIIDVEAIRKARLKVVIDSMHGSGAGWTAKLFEEAGCEVSELRSSHDPLFGGVAPEPTKNRIWGLMEEVARSGADFGVANDGDADRLSASDERGHFFSPQRILAIFAWYMKAVKKAPGGVAKAVSATCLIDRLGELYSFPVVTTPIGFKHMSPYLESGSGFFMAGEESGAIGLSCHIPERDGLFNALLMAEIRAVTGLGPRAALQRVFDETGHFTYDRKDVHFLPEEMERVREKIARLDELKTLAGLSVSSIDRLDGVKLVREDGSWLLIRASGTEPLLRIYAEARLGVDVKNLLIAGKEIFDS